jgi:hypothetical protein
VPVLLRCDVCGRRVMVGSVRATTGARGKRLGTRRAIFSSLLWLLAWLAVDDSLLTQCRKEYNQSKLGIVTTKGEGNCRTCGVHQCALIVTLGESYHIHYSMQPRRSFFYNHIVGTGIHVPCVVIKINWTSVTMVTSPFSCSLNSGLNANLWFRI